MKRARACFYVMRDVWDAHARRRRRYLYCVVSPTTCAFLPETYTNASNCELSTAHLPRYAFNGARIDMHY